MMIENSIPQLISVRVWFFFNIFFISFPIVMADINVKLSIVDIITDRIDIINKPYKIGKSQKTLNSRDMQGVFEFKHIAYIPQKSVIISNKNQHIITKREKRQIINAKYKNNK